MFESTAAARMPSAPSSVIFLLDCVIALHRWRTPRTQDERLSLSSNDEGEETIEIRIVVRSDSLPFTLVDLS